MELIEKILNFRNVADPLLISEQFLPYVAGLAGLGFVMGMTVAFGTWYRSASSIEKLEEETAELKKGDIDVSGDDAGEGGLEGDAVSGTAVAVSGAALARDSDSDIAFDDDLSFAATERPDDADDLTLLEGIDAEKAAEMNRAGIYRFSQLEGMNEEERRKFSFKFGWPDINWGAWAATAAAAGIGGQTLLDRRDERAEELSGTLQADDDDFRIAGALDEAPGNADDLTVLEGIDEARAGELNRAGIYRFSQLEGLSTGEREELSRRLDWPQIELGIGAGAAALAVGLAGSLGKGEEATGENEGITSTSEEGRDDAAGTLEPAPSIPDWAMGGGDDLSVMAGVDPEDAARLNSEGVYTMAQLESWPAGRRRAMQSNFSWSDLDWDSWLVPAAAVTAGAVAAHDQGDQGGGENESNSADTVSPESSPEVRDWTWGDSFRETDAHVSDPGPGSVESPVETSDGDAAMHQAKKETEAVWEAERIRLATGSSAADQEVAVSGDSGTDFSTAGMAVGAAGAFGALGMGLAQRPDHADDLTEINGIDSEIEGKLNELGIHTHDQIAKWSEENIGAVEAELGAVGRITREEWVSQAIILSGVGVGEMVEKEPERPERLGYMPVVASFEGENIELDEDFGVVYRERPEVVDDLKQIRGIGAVIEGKLNAKGIYRFRQIASWNPYNVWVFGRELDFPGRITRENWVSQAGELVEPQVEVPPGETLVAPDPVPETSETGEENPAVVPGAIDPPKPDIPGVVTSPAPDMGIAAAGAAAPATISDLDGNEIQGIFGLGESESSRVVFVMDVSRSLTPAQLQMSKDELGAALRRLPESTRYQVIFFSGASWFAHQRMIEGGARGEDVVIEDRDGTMTWHSGFGGFEFEDGNDNLPTADWLSASPDNISSTLADIEAVEKSYGTTWNLPLTMAMNLEPAPESIYFLTDGETARQERVAEEMVEMAIKRGVQRIHTIAMMVPGASVSLNRIARGTNGDHCLVVAGGKVLRDHELRTYLAEKDIRLDD